MPFDPIDPRQSFPDLELGILKYWQEEDVFKRSMSRRKENEVFSFYDGPPFATGLPHYGHLLAGTIKDVIPRYQTMKGKYVERRFGWDCHGLPIENIIEKENKLTSKKDIEALGVGKFNDLCRSAVQRYTGDWRKVVERLGRFVDMDNDYRTMDPEYMESIWWVFKELHKQGLIYEGWKPMHLCPRCQTPLSNFEVTQGYSDRTDMSVIFTFPLIDEPDTHILAWTTTPWSLPGNLWLLVGPDIPYVKVQEKGSETVYILAEKLVPEVFKKREHTIVGTISAKELVGKKYKPLFPYYKDTVIPSTEKTKPQTYGQRCFQILMDEHGEVTDADGTGIVHITNSHGEDGFNISKKLGIDVLHHLHTDGSFKPEVTDFKGLYAKPFDGKDPMSTDKAIIAELKKIGRYFKSFTYDHSYPHCWRCDTPLLNYAMSSWFVAVEKIKDKMLQANTKTEWVPSHLRDGRFGKWLEGARDWAISRSRFWGTPLPIWRNTTTGEIDVIGSRDELMQKAPQRFTKVIMARHAESQGNVDMVYQGAVPGTSLTEKGEKQAASLAQDIVDRSKKNGVSITTIYCSPLERTQQTAQAIAEATGATVIVDDRLKEINFGEYEGKHIDFDDLTFIRERRAHKLETKQVESIYHFHGMETWSNVELRLGAFLDETLTKHKGEGIVIVTHADLVMNAKHYFTKQEPQKIVNQPYPEVASAHTYFWDHERQAQMDLHKETVDGIMWSSDKGKKNPTSLKLRGARNEQSVELTLVRHGETDMNKMKIIQGAEVNMPLNAVGKEQAKKAAEMLKGKKFDVILTSDLKRAKQTASVIAKALGMEVTAESPLLRERHAGEWQSMPMEDFWKTVAKKTNVGWTMTKETPQDGESFEQFMTRARKAQEWILREYAGKKVLVVSHGGVCKAWLNLSGEMSYDDVVQHEPKNAHPYEFTLVPKMQRIDEVLDCWFESGSMPYAQGHFPFENNNDVPAGFPADFIAEGLDQTRGWFYTLMVLSSALFDCPAFKHCVVNGIVLAEDGKKMSKKLKNYPEPTEVITKHGADAVRFALMGSPAVRGEDLRFSEKIVEETVRSVLLPLWNAYRLFVTYANGSEWEPSVDFSLKNATSTHLLDQWIIAKTQTLVNSVTTELDGYDLSATCSHIADSIDDLTNWYVRLSRRRLAGKEEGQNEAFDTLYRVLVAMTQLLAPFCPFITEDIYLNLVGEDHDSVHFSDWPHMRELTNEEIKTLALMENTRTIVTLGLSLRSDAKIRVRQPLQSVTYALPPSDTVGVLRPLIEEELNVKQVIVIEDASSLADRSVLVDARKVGKRLGGKVQDVIKAGKAGEFEEKPDGTIVILGETFTLDEAKIVYLSAEGSSVAASRGIVVSLDTSMTDALTLEGQARELIHAIQQLRKDAGLEFTDTVTLSLSGADAIMAEHEKLVLEETRSVLGETKAKAHEIDLEGVVVKIAFEKKE